jgi:diaminopimelate epimerase
MRLTEFLSGTPKGSTPGRPFIKMHGLRNHFVIFDRRKQPFPLSTADIVRICDVHTGVGAEQVLTLEQPSAQSGAYAAMRIFNIDGRETGACGNATRCVAHLLFEESGSEELLLETEGGLLPCAKTGAMDVSVTLGPITMDWRAIPLSEACDTAYLPISSGPLKNGLALHIGNPHAVFFVTDLDAVNIPLWAPAIQNDPLFPEGINVGVAQAVDPHTLRLAVWERPGMLTEACGTGACVAAFAGRLRGLLSGERITVQLPAGRLGITLLGDDRAIMTGPVAFCCRGYV